MKKIMKVIATSLMLSIVIFSACNKKGNPALSKIPIVTIDSITNISLTTADVNADITFDGGYAITEKGICWGKNPNPTISDTKAMAGTGSDWFSAKITGLVKGSNYYVRSYAVNSEGTGYSDQQIVKPGTVTDMDGNVYDIVTIGGKTWMAGNLRVTKYNNGDPIPLVTSITEWKKLKTGAYCYVNNSAGTANDYGLLYNWYAAFDKRGICPKGFKVVTYGMYSTLGGSSAGGSLKTVGTSYWQTPNDGATNSTGFSAKGTGYRDSGGVYLDFNKTCYFWDVELGSGSQYATTAYLDYNSTEYYTNWYNKDKRHGFSVRCVK